MNLTEFKRLNKDRPQQEKLMLLVNAMQDKSTNMVSYTEAEWLGIGNMKHYYARKILDLNARINWLYNDILAHMKSNEELCSKPEIK